MAPPDPTADGQPHPPIVEALPDLQSTPSGAKKPKLFHVGGEASSSSLPTTASDQAGVHTAENGDVRMEDDKEGAVAGPSTLNVPPARQDEEAEGNDGTPAMTAIPLPEVVDAKEEFWDLKMSWCGKIYEMSVGGNDMVYDFKGKIEELTNVPPARQKLIGLSKGKLSAEFDATRFGTLGVKNPCKFQMIGTPEALSFKDPDWMTLPEIIDDFDVTYSNHPLVAGKPVVAPADDPRNKRLLADVIKKHPITIMNEPREGKRLLVLDLDYTLVDTKPLLAGSLPAEECARPGMHEFLEAVYPHYDIVIWSQTHWRWLESKLVELGVIGGSREYKICFVADRTSMFPVFTQRNGQPWKHECVVSFSTYETVLRVRVKPLAYFWASYPHWSAKNSVHIDDLSRNFALNPGEGLKIRAFNAAGTMDGLRDRELGKLATYLTGIASKVEDFTTVDHSKWKKAIREPRPPQ